MKTESSSPRTACPKPLAALLRAILTCVVLLALPCVAQAQYRWTTNNGSITITDYTTSDRSVTFPSTINGLPVTGIASYAFENCFNLTNVMLGTSITNVGEEAFAGLGLVAITVDAQNPAFSSLDGVLFDKHQTTLISFPEGKAGAYALPNSTTSIGNAGFWGCNALTNITIPYSVSNIGDGAFTFCSGLTNLAIPPSVTSIGGSAFYRCVNLANLTIPASVTNLGFGAFYGCWRLTSVTLSASVTSIRDGTFASCSALTNVTIPGSVTNLGMSVFYDCTGLTSVTIPNSVSSIGPWAFDGCSSLTSVTFPASVTSIPYEMFLRCWSLTRVAIPNGVRSIGDWAFAGCSNLATVTIPASVTTLGSNVFIFTGLTGVYFEGDAPTVGPDVFSADSNATVFYLPGTEGWGATFAGRPSALWNPHAGSPAVGVKPAQFGFTVTGTSNIVVLVEASTTLANPIWSPLATNTLSTGSAYFSDPEWANYPGRFYRLRWP